MKHVIFGGDGFVGRHLAQRLVSDGEDVVVRVRDTAPVFDPATAPAFDADLPLEQRPLGHMGLALIRELCTAFDHRALPDGGNEVTFRRPTAAAARKGET